MWTRLSTIVARFDQIDSTIAQMKVEYTRSIEAIEKIRVEREREIEKIRRTDVETQSKAIGEIRKSLEGIQELKKGLQIRSDEDIRLGRLIDEIDKKITDEQRQEEEYRRMQKLMEENRRQDSKRLTDLQAEVVALRKRSDEQRGKVDLSTESVRKLELRVNEVQTNESERKQTTTAFIEKQSLLQVEKDRTWKEWETRFTEINKQAYDLNVEMQAVDSALRTLKRSKESFEEITQAFDRRINEITEMQRLVEDRFRQEWISFKADDQKRWTNYALSQEEQQRESVRQLEKQNVRLLALEDSTQESLDHLQQIKNDTYQRLKSIAETAHVFLEDYEQLIGKSNS